jgi:methyltransferase (TIGR00027 family)
MESCSEAPILKDEQAEYIVRQIDPLLAGSRDRFLSMLYRRQIEPQLVVHAALRARKYDQFALEYLNRHPDSVIVNLGCGMDTRYQRIDDRELTFFDLDLPVMIRFKRRFLQESERYRMIAASVLETAWMEQVGEFVNGPVLFMAEGLFMYLEPDQVKSLVLELQDRFPGSELVCEVANRRWMPPGE